MHGLKVTYICVADTAEARRRDGAGRDLIQRLAKHLWTIGEIDPLLARGREESYAVARPQRCAHVFQHRGAHLRHVLGAHVHVVKDKSDETSGEAQGRAGDGRGISGNAGSRRTGCGRGPPEHCGTRRLHERKFRNLLLLTLVQNMEVFLLQISYRVAFAVPHHYRNLHQVGLYPKSHGSIGGDHLVVFQWRSGRSGRSRGGRRFGWFHRRRGWPDVQSLRHLLGFRLTILRCLPLGGWRRPLGLLRHLRRARIVITRAGLHIELAPIPQLHFQLVEAALRRRSVRREAQNINEFRRSGELPDCPIQIVRVAYELAARAVAYAQLKLPLAAGRRPEHPALRAHAVRRQTTRVHAVHHHPGPYGVVDQPHGLRHGRPKKWVRSCNRQAR